MRKPIKNKMYQTIGWLQEEDRFGRKVIWALSFKYARLGYYDPSKNRTYNFLGQWIGTGDLTSSLIWENYNKNPKTMGEK